MLKKLVFISVIVLICLSISGCKEPTQYQQSIYNDNSLIVKEGDSFFTSRYSSKGSNGDIKVTFSKLTGSKTLWDIDYTEEKEININYSTKKSNGEFKLVLINPDGKIYYLNEKTTEGKYSSKLAVGKNRIKVVGNSATGEIVLKIDK